MFQSKFRKKKLNDTILVFSDHFGNIFWTEKCLLVDFSRFFKNQKSKIRYQWNFSAIENYKT
jgi:hypothetical protein